MVLYEIYYHINIVVCLHYAMFIRIVIYIYIYRVYLVVHIKCVYLHIYIYIIIYRGSHVDVEIYIPVSVAS